MSTPSNLVLTWFSHYVVCKVLDKEPEYSLLPPRSTAVQAKEKLQSLYDSGVEDSQVTSQEYVENLDYYASKHEESHQPASLEFRQSDVVEILESDEETNTSNRNSVTELKQTASTASVQTDLTMHSLTAEIELLKNQISILEIEKNSSELQVQHLHSRCNELTEKVLSLRAHAQCQATNHAFSKAEMKDKLEEALKAEERTKVNSDRWLERYVLQKEKLRRHENALATERHRKAKELNEVIQRAEKAETEAMFWRQEYVRTVEELRNAASDLLTNGDKMIALANTRPLPM
ncbi:hypothetical protein C8R41DRAFT_916109 [Lentinula lateritia]|uniref:Uncharacterized protein n=1 Tax=Lentinula lateritia TaxID=40482 RepID=A0ABQ8VQD2_9AGAR|nr:hypothetical protein C8R41DRAFT_916109 [Lentinula lateritia]